MNKNGIAVAGNLVADYVKQVNTFPKPGMLTNILDTSRSVGGSVPNVLIDLARMGGDIPLEAIGCVGKDEQGAFLTAALAANGIDTSFITPIDTPTSFSDAISAADTGERTFFHYRGANAKFAPAHIPLGRVKSRILHIAYLLLLDVFDSADAEYCTVMARFLHDAQQAGYLTSIDCVSDAAGRFEQVVKPALKYSDYIILNEIEGCTVWGLKARDENDKLIRVNIKAALEGFISAGVGKLAVIHCPEAGFCLDSAGNYTEVPSLRLPKGFVKCSVGAGDAFCAGCLRAIYKGMSAEKMLTFAAAAAAASLSENDSVSGVKTEAEIWELNARLRG